MRTALCLWLCLACAAPVGAAGVTLHPDGNLVVLEGRIERGDLAKVQELARQASPTAMYLASRGGDLAEAMRIGFFVRGRAWETRTAEAESVPAEMRASRASALGVRDPVRNNVCASACFMIFVAGIYREGHALGIHTPQISAADLERLSADQAASKSSDVKTAVGIYLFRMGVPARYLGAMFDVPHDKIRWLTEEEIAADLHGFAPDVRPWVAGQCGLQEVESATCRETVMLGIRLRSLASKAPREAHGANGANGAKEPK